MATMYSTTRPPKWESRRLREAFCKFLPSSFGIDSSVSPPGVEPGLSRPRHDVLTTSDKDSASCGRLCTLFFLDESLDSFDKQQQPWCRARIDGVGLHAKTSEQIRVVGTHRWRSPRLGRTKILLLLPAASSFKVTLTHHIRLLI